ncbi:MAG: GIY-YIG nuclease family protein [Ignavibacteria bacterium]|nr:GIY-YIG nuclease family protein [Ignavibacteria bacterium]
MSRFRMCCDCARRLSRRLSVGLPKHNLGAVADFYGCGIAARHRAMGDTEATAKVLLKLIERARGEHDALTLGDLIALQHAPKSTTSAKSTSKVKQLLAPRLNELPDEPGVYYFLNTKKTVLYVGKAKSLRNRVNTYFHDGPLRQVRAEDGALHPTHRMGRQPAPNSAQCCWNRERSRPNTRFITVPALNIILRPS